MDLFKELQKRRDFARDCARIATSQGSFDAALYNERIGDEMQALLDRAEAMPQRALPAADAVVVADFLNEFAAEFTAFAAEQKHAANRSEIVAALRGEEC